MGPGDRLTLGLIGGAGTEGTDTAAGVGRKFRPAELRQVVVSCFCQFKGIL